MNDSTKTFDRALDGCSEVLATDADPHEFQFVLLPGFSLLSVVTALETLQNANLCAGKSLYSWKFFSTGDNPSSSLGDRPFACEKLEDCETPSDIVVVGGTSVSDLRSRKLNVWLSRHARGKVRVTGLSTGAFAPANAELFRSVPATLHWQFRDTFSEAYSDVELSDRPFLSDGKRCSSSGGISAIDLFLDFIEQHQGAHFANDVAESMNYVTVRQAQQISSAEASARKRIKNIHLQNALKMMEENLEAPISPSIIAESVGISTRQLERLFQRRLSQTPNKFYMQLRLRKAFFLLAQTAMSVVDVGLACGFSSHSHFSKCFRIEYGYSPTQFLKGRSG